jgi:hypothetical protein
VLDDFRLSADRIEPTTRGEWIMSKKKHQQGAGTSNSSSSSTGTGKKREVKSFVERLIVKADVIYARATEIALACEKRGVPSDVIRNAKEFIPLAETYRERFFALRTSGPDGTPWAPAAKGAVPQIKEGDKVAFKAEFRSKYAYIPGVENDTAVFVASKILPRGKRDIEVLLKDSEGHPYGYSLGSQLEHR